MLECARSCWYFSYLPIRMYGTKGREATILPSWRNKCLEILRRKVPILQWLPCYTLGKFLQDCLAGFTVGLTAIPQGIAYAVVAGLPPQYGLYSSFMGCFLYLIFGSSKDINVGPTAIMALLTQQYVVNYGADFAVLLCFLSGCVILLMGVLHLGFLLDFISMPVICGFTNAAAVIIGSSQLHSLLGMSGRSESFIDAINKIIQHWRDTRLWDSVLGVCSVVALVLLKNLPGKKSGTWAQKSMWLANLSRNAVIVIFGIILTFSLSIHGIQPFQLTGKVVKGLPPLDWPPFSTTANNRTYDFIEMTETFGSSILAVPLIAILESIAIGKAFAKGRALDSNQEMLALGFCNIFGSFVRSMPTTGSFTRTAVNNASGVQTPMAGLITGAIVILACGFLTKAFEFIPKATLSAVIIVAMYYMLDIRVFCVLWKSKRIDVLPLTVTLLCCLTIGLEYGMLAGIAVNLVLLLYSSARPILTIETIRAGSLEILLVSPQQSLSFPAAEYLRERVMSRCVKLSEPVPVVIDGRQIHRIDATVAKNLTLLKTDLQLRRQSLIFWNWNQLVKETLTSYSESMSTDFVSSPTVGLIFSDENAADLFRGPSPHRDPA